MKYIYALGLSETGGCWLPNERAYSTFELADAARVKSHVYMSGVFHVHETACLSLCPQSIRYYVKV